jgi:hypothetical protein
VVLGQSGNFYFVVIHVTKSDMNDKHNQAFRMCERSARTHAPKQGRVFTNLCNGSSERNLQSLLCCRRVLVRQACYFIIIIIIVVIVVVVSVILMFVKFWSYCLSTTSLGLYILYVGYFRRVGLWHYLLVCNYWLMNGRCLPYTLRYYVHWLSPYCISHASFQDFVGLSSSERKI